MLPADGDALKREGPDGCLEQPVHVGCWALWDGNQEKPFSDSTSWYTRSILLGRQGSLGD